MSKRKLDVAFLLNDGARFSAHKRFHGAAPEKEGEEPRSENDMQKPLLPSISSMLSVAPTDQYNSYHFYTQNDTQWPLLQPPFQRRAYSVPDIIQPTHEMVNYDLSRRTSVPPAHSTAEPYVPSKPVQIKNETPETTRPREKGTSTSGSPSNIKFVLHMEQFGGEDSGSGEDDSLSTDEIASAAFETTNPEEFKKSLTKELPVRVLAYALGLNSDPQKGWRYRDIKRLLFDNLPKDQHDFIKKNNKHKLLIQRLPNRLTMEQFCKRIALLVYHFVLRDGREPKFFRRDLTRRDMLERVLKQTSPAFWETTCTKVAMIAHALIAGGASIEEAITAVDKKKDLNAFYNV